MSIDKTIKVSEDARKYIQELQTKDTRTTKFIVDMLIKNHKNPTGLDDEVFERLEKIREDFNLIDIGKVIRFALDKIKDDIREVEDEDKRKEKAKKEETSETK